MLRVKSRGTSPSIEQNSANWYLRFISLWALSPGSRGNNCLVSLNCKQLSLWSAPFALTLFELCFPLAFWEPFALCPCVEKERHCVLHTFFRVWAMFPHANTYSHAEFLSCTHFQNRSVSTWTSFFFLSFFFLNQKVYQLPSICKQVWMTWAH